MNHRKKMEDAEVKSLRYFILYFWFNYTIVFTFYKVTVMQSYSTFYFWLKKSFSRSIFDAEYEFDVHFSIWLFFLAENWLVFYLSENRRKIFTIFTMTLFKKKCIFSWIKSSWISWIFFCDFHLDRKRVNFLRERTVIWKNEHQIHIQRRKLI